MYVVTVDASDDRLTPTMATFVGKLFGKWEGPDFDIFGPVGQNNSTHKIITLSVIIWHHSWLGTVRAIPLIPLILSIKFWVVFSESTENTWVSCYSWLHFWTGYRREAFIDYDFSRALLHFNDLWGHRAGMLLETGMQDHNIISWSLKVLCSWTCQERAKVYTIFTLWHNLSALWRTL